MIRTKDDQSFPRRGQLGRFRKASNSRESTTTVLDFFGMKKEKTDVHGIPEWENPVEAGRPYQTTPEKVSPRRPQRFGSPRIVGRHKSAPVYKQTAAAALSSKYSPGTHKTPHSDPSQYVTQSLENMVIECRPGGEENLGASLGDITLDGSMADLETSNHRPSFQQHEQQQQQPPAPPRRAPENNPSITISQSQGVSVDRVRIAHADDPLRPPSAFGTRRKTSTSIDRPPSSPSKQSSSVVVARIREEEEEERMIQFAMERSLHDKIGSSPSTKSYRSDCGNSLASSNNAINLASAGCHLSMIAASPRAVQRSTSSEAGADPVAWRKEGKRWLKLDPHPNNETNDNSSRGENDNHHAIQEDDNAESHNRRHHNHQHHNDFVAKTPRRAASLDTDVAKRWLRELEEEKRMLEQTMVGRMEEQQQLVTGAASVMSDSAPSLDGLDNENADNIQKREEALIAEALKRSMQEM